MGIETIDNNQELYFNNKKNGLELGDISLQKISEDEKVI